jgi:hypothetical protein
MGAKAWTVPAGRPQVGLWRSYSFQTLLLLGWIGLFAYSTAYLFDEVPFRVSSIPGGSEALIAQSEDMPRQLMLAVASVPPTNDSASAVAPPAPSIPAGQPVVPSDTARSRSTGPEYVGTWGPTAAACGVPSRRHNFYRATITPGLAKAGDTTCSFHGQHRAGNAWTMAADCRDHGQQWTSQVRLFVDGDHLTWTSAKGSSNYVRCSRRTI